MVESSGGTTHPTELLRNARGGIVLIVGAGVTGRAGVKLFGGAGYRVAVCDEKAQSAESRAALAGCDIIDAVTRNSLETYLSKNDVRLAVASPGFNPRGVVLTVLRERRVPIMSELDVAFPFLGHPDIAVTGTNGKTTTVHLIEAMLKESGIRVELIGNVGLPFMSHVDPGALERLEAPPDNACWVAELSSYQLETVRSVKPHIAALLNVEDDHLERHGSFGEYLRVKLRIFAEQSADDDYSVVYADDHWFDRAREAARGRIVPFGVWREELSARAELAMYHPAEREIELRLHGNVERYPVTATRLVGIHNKLNLCAAIACARLRGASPAAIQHVVNTFSPLEHRVELVREVGGVRYINDSKGTNVSAVAVALDTVIEEIARSKGRVVLLLGGKVKEGSWEPVRRRLGDAIRSVIAFGGDGDVILDTLRNAGLSCPAERVPWLADAVRRSSEIAVSGDVVLLSPGAASFDAYSDYAARGRHFKELVGALE